MAVLLELLTRLTLLPALAPADLAAVAAVALVLGLAVTVAAVSAGLVVVRALSAAIRVAPPARLGRPVAETLPRAAVPAARPRPRAPMAVLAAG